MWLPFISKIDRLKKEKKKLQNDIHEIIQSVQHILKTHGTFIISKVGSDNNVYKINRKLFEFNEFSHKYCGFFINNKRVSLETFIKEAQKP